MATDLKKIDRDLHNVEMDLEDAINDEKDRKHEADWMFIELASVFLNRIEEFRKALATRI